MPRTTTTTVSQNEKGQYQVTIPKGLGDALDLKDKKVQWTIGSNTDTLEMEVIDDK